MPVLMILSHQVVQFIVGPGHGGHCLGQWAPDSSLREDSSWAQETRWSVRYAACQASVIPAVVSLRPLFLCV